MRRSNRWLLIFSVLLIYNSLSAQLDTTGIWRITTLDGNQYIGEIISVDSDSIKIQAQNIGAISLAQAKVKFSEKVLVQKEALGEYWPENHHATRYFFSPNGYSLTKGEGYYQNNWVLFNQVSVGLTDYISVGAGTVPTYLLGADAGPVWITPKVSFPIRKDKWSAGFGALAGTILGETDSGFGILYGVTTIGSKDKNVTLGVGYGYFDGTLASSPIITASAMSRINERSFLISENYWFGSENGGLLSLGGRTAWKNVALDYGGVIPYGFEDTIVIIPWLGISVPFGKKNVLQKQD